ncbi:MAG: hypothetical protein JW995_12725 [Melioribacteraceae bacterium]|nr:hypothetical protein [Melioribacteraceae bacterium]
MSYYLLKEKIGRASGISNVLLTYKTDGCPEIKVYPKSLKELKNSILFFGLCNTEKFFFIAYDKNSLPDWEDFNKIKFSDTYASDGFVIIKCLLNTSNRKILQKNIDYLNPKVIGLKNSFGFGDRLGLANAAHLRSLGNSSFLPILAQQSIRELTRTNRTPDEVMDAAVWSVMQEGYKNTWGSDADHLKTTADIDLMANAGYTMFTFDPSEYVDNNADNYNEAELTQKFSSVNWGKLSDKLQSAVKRYLDQPIIVDDQFSISVDELSLKRAYVKYGNAVLHIKTLYEYLKNNYNAQPFEVEVSVDETESVTTPFEHYFFANELVRLGVRFISLAPRFVGDFEKGIDYKGDPEIFRTEYEKHVAIINHFGTYKISLHSGSDKFSAYRVIGGIKNAVTHVKTAGTSYLEALRVVAVKQPELFRDILDFSVSLYEDEKKTYHVSADANNVKDASDYTDAELAELFNSNDVRQILHVAFGKVLTVKNETGSNKYKDEILNCLRNNEETHYELLVNHFRKHLKPFEQE